MWLIIVITIISISISIKFWNHFVFTLVVGRQGPIFVIGSTYLATTTVIALECSFISIFLLSIVYFLLSFVCCYHITLLLFGAGLADSKRWGGRETYKWLLRDRVRRDKTEKKKQREMLLLPPPPLPPLPPLFFLVSLLLSTSLSLSPSPPHQILIIK